MIVLQQFAKHKLILRRMMINLEAVIRHINPFMFDMIDDKPEGVARGV